MSVFRRSSHGAPLTSDAGQKNWLVALTKPEGPPQRRQSTSSDFARPCLLLVGSAAATCATRCSKCDLCYIALLEEAQKSAAPHPSEEAKSRERVHKGCAAGV